MGKKLKILTFVLLVVMVWTLPTLAVQKGEKLPDYELKDLKDNNVMVSEYLGDGYVLIDVWATWCKYCIEAFESYTANMDQFEEAGIEIVAISTDAQKKSLTRFLEEEMALPFTVLHDKYNTASRKWNVRGIPATFLINPEGVVIKSTIGVKPFDLFMNEMKEAIKMDKNPLAQAKELKADTYKMKLVDLDYREIRANLEVFPLNFDSRPVMPQAQFDHVNDPEFEGTPLYAYIPFLYDRQLVSFIAVDENEDKASDLLYFDENRNLDFTDDGDVITLKQGQDRSGKPMNELERVIPVKIQKDITVNYHLAAYFSKMWSGYFIVPMQGFETQVDSDLGKLRVTLIDADSNGEWHNDDDMIFIDLNGNGTFDSYSGQEWTRLGDPIKLGDETYQLKIQPNDKEILLELAK